MRRLLKHVTCRRKRLILGPPPGRSLGDFPGRPGRIPEQGAAGGL